MEARADIARQCDGRRGASSRKRPFSSSGYDGRASQGLKLAYCQFSAVVSEIPALLEYIDFGGPPDCLRIGKTGGYMIGL